ncbi:MAG: hypothetical protein P4L82_01275, partial [Ancalomicrobiaceae bacterium]|nr:hypothetical protein [Ancalomicrobiaceae bacterium]
PAGRRRHHSRLAGARLAPAVGKGIFELSAGAEGLQLIVFLRQFRSVKIVEFSGIGRRALPQSGIFCPWN